MEQILLTAGLIALCVLAVRAPKLFSSKEPIQTADSQVVSRRCTMPDGSYSNFRGNKMQYYVTFLVNEELLELSVTGSQYARLTEGSSVHITWKGTGLVDFKTE